jgi:hypothetical protein
MTATGHGRKNIFYLFGYIVGYTIMPNHIHALIGF